MMNSFNAIGRLTKDPEGSTTANGKVYVNFSIAVDRGFKDSEGNKIVDFLPCVAWEATATLITKYFKKGDLIGISGRLETSKSTKDGKTTTYYNIRVLSIDFIQGKKETKPETATPAPAPAPTPAPIPTPIEDLVNETNYELPFDLDEETPPFDV